MLSRPRRIEARLRELYPCGELPVGAFVDLAREFGVSWQRIDQIARGIGFRGPGPGVRPRPKALCAACGKELPRTAAYALCVRCRWVTLSCAVCGMDVRRSAAKIASRRAAAQHRREGEPEYVGRVFCNRQCLGRWMGKQNAGRRGGVAGASHAV